MLRAEHRVLGLRLPTSNRRITRARLGVEVEADFRLLGIHIERNQAYHSYKAKCTLRRSHLIGLDKIRSTAGFQRDAMCRFTTGFSILVSRGLSTTCIKLCFL